MVLKGVLKCWQPDRIPFKGNLLLGLDLFCPGLRDFFYLFIIFFQTASKTTEDSSITASKIILIQRGGRGPFSKIEGDVQSYLHFLAYP